MVKRRRSVAEDESTKALVFMEMFFNQRQIAEACGVSHRVVATWRASPERMREEHLSAMRELVRRRYYRYAESRSARLNLIAEEMKRLALRLLPSTFFKGSSLAETCRALALHMIEEGGVSTRTKVREYMMENTVRTRPVALYRAAKHLRIHYGDGEWTGNVAALKKWLDSPLRSRAQPETDEDN